MCGAEGVVKGFRMVGWLRMGVLRWLFGRGIGMSEGLRSGLVGFGLWGIKVEIVEVKLKSIYR